MPQNKSLENILKEKLLDYELSIDSNQIDQNQSNIINELELSQISTSNDNSLFLQNTPNISLESQQIQFDVKNVQIINKQPYKQYQQTSNQEKLYTKQSTSKQQKSSISHSNSEPQPINNSKIQFSKQSNNQTNNQQQIHQKINLDIYTITTDSQIKLDNICYSFQYLLKNLQQKSKLQKFKSKLKEQLQKNKTVQTCYYTEQKSSNNWLNNQDNDKILQVLKYLDLDEPILNYQQSKNVLEENTKRIQQKNYQNLQHHQSSINQYKEQYNYVKIQIYLKKQNQQKKFIKQYQLSRDIIKLVQIRYKQKGMQFKQKTFIQQLGILFSMYYYKLVIFQIKAIQNILLGVYHQDQNQLIKNIVSLMLAEKDDKNLSEKIQQAFDILWKFIQNLITDKSSQDAKQFYTKFKIKQEYVFPFIKSFFISKLKQIIKQQQEISSFPRPAQPGQQNNQNFQIPSQFQDIKIKRIQNQNRQQKLSQSIDEIQKIMAQLAPKNILSAGTITERLKLLFFIASGFQNITRCFRPYNFSQQFQKYKIQQSEIKKQKFMVLQISNIHLTLVGLLGFDFNIQWNDVGVLDCSASSMKDQVFRYMIQYIRNFPNLRTLHLKNNKLTELTRKNLQDIKNLTKTTYINLQNNNLSKQTIKVIRQFQFQQQKRHKKLSNNAQQLKKPQNRIITIQFDDDQIQFKTSLNDNLFKEKI